ncbi:MAG: NAD-dependent epimerase/dehydratase family protein [Chloroflexota bacterium]
MPKRVLVTGGAGFIGSHITDTLIERGDKVVIIDNESTGRRDFVHPDAEYHTGDVRSMDDLDKVFEQPVDAVMHIAGQASIRKSFMNPVADLEVNTIGTINVLRKCIEYKVPRLLFASSMTVYGTPDLAPTPETAPIAPLAYYGVTKYAAERYVHLTAARKDINFDFHVTSMRMFNVYGPRQSLTNAYQGVFAIFMGNVLREEAINIHSDGEQSRDFVHVKDVANAWCTAMDTADTHGEVMNIGTGRPTSVNQLCDLVLKSFGHTRDTYEVNHHPAQPGDIRVSAADISKAERLMGWQPTIPFEQGMAETIEWAKSQPQ